MKIEQRNGMFNALESIDNASGKRYIPLLPSHPRKEGP